MDKEIESLKLQISIAKEELQQLETGYLFPLPAGKSGDRVNYFSPSYFDHFSSYFRTRKPYCWIERRGTASSGYTNA